MSAAAAMTGIADAAWASYPAMHRARADTMPSTKHYFEAMFAESDDPWGFRSRWYEVRKRALTLACLPQARYASAYEPGCANGELSAALATRCDALRVSDGTPAAVHLARARLAAFDHVEVVQAWVPDDWPDAQFDLIVISELGYFLSRESLDLLATKMLGSLSERGTVLACHWRRPIAGFALDGDIVHDVLDMRLSLPRLSRLVEEDLRIEVWCRDARSVGTREGLR